MRYTSVLCRADDAQEKCSTLGGSKAPVSLASSEEMIQRMPGVCLVFSDSVSEVPPVFTHMLENLPAIYETVIFVTVRSAFPLVDILCPEMNCRRSLLALGPAKPHVLALSLCGFPSHVRSALKGSNLSMKCTPRLHLAAFRRHFGIAN